MKKVLITSIGRTGTTSLSAYLNSIPDVFSIHEKEKQDVGYLFLSTVKDYSIVSDSYLKERINIYETLDSNFYIEVNPYLRFANLKILKSEGWKIIFLVRNPKTYLESVYTRKLFRENDFLLQQLPNNKDDIAKKWSKLTRFQKLCWYYANVHEYIINSNEKYFQYEEIVKKPEILMNLLKEIGIPKSNIKNLSIPRKNTSASYRLKNKFKNLIKREKDTFEKLNWNTLTKNELDYYLQHCLNIGKKLGYDLP